ncbi:carbonic anhydrase [Micromonospora matsumotoense]|uniref:carbonic anhydrase n=1 Tax=Micromonospora matsumotoense TaxID=121616 RepID=UPI003D8BC7A8
MAPITPTQALAELSAGNRRFVAGEPRHPNQGAGHRAAVADGQHPFAVIVGCSDSRLAAEIIFDRGLGDLFVVRTAGHTAGPEVLGSVEYAVTILGTPLVVVLGHDSCGAVQAARDAARTGTQPPGHLYSVVAAVGPSLRRAAQEGVHDIDGIVDIHIAQTVEVLLGNSPVIAAEVAAGRCAVVGMSYRLAAGEVRQVAPAHAPAAEAPTLTAAVSGPAGPTAGAVGALAGVDAGPVGSAVPATGEPATVAG